MSFRSQALMGRSLMGRTMVGRSLVALALAAVIARPSILHAQVTTFADRAAFLTATGTPTFSVDFESYSADVCYVTTPLDVGPFTMRTNNTETLCRLNAVDVSPFEFPSTSSFGNATLRAQVSRTGPVDMLFTARITSLFGDFYHAGNNSPLRLALMFDDGTTSEVDVPGTGISLDPFGFSSTKAITSLQFRNVAVDGFTLDNIIGTVGTTPTTTVPEPSTYLMLGTGLLLLGGAARRRRQV